MDNKRSARTIAGLLLWIVLWSGLALAQNDDAPLLLVLADTGQVRDGLPVLKRHTEERMIAAALSRGFPLKMLRLYRNVQIYLNAGASIHPEPAYLLFSSHQGGFPRFGFYLEDEIKQGVGYVDLFRTKTFVGRFGAVDQIFPHELGHIIVRLLSGEPTPGGASQLHAIAVRTDPRVAFQEGFAEHLQVMAVDDPEADSRTHALAKEGSERLLAERQLVLYRRELQAFWSFASPKKMGFLFWYSPTEQVLRYHSVKENAFARAPEIPDRLLNRRNLYPAYLLENIFPGTPAGRPKPASVMLSTEGVVSSLFYRWVRDLELEGRYVDESFYSRFGTGRDSISPVENAYLKLFHAIHMGRSQDVTGVIESYKSAFPGESRIIDKILADVLLRQRPAKSVSVWLANPDFQVGTGLFDQFRSVSRVHTFDLNAATVVDLLGVPGMSRGLAETILKTGPYSSLADLERAPGMSTQVFDRFKMMAREMERINGNFEGSAMESLPRIVMSYLWRALLVLALASISGGMLYRHIRQVELLRSLTNGLAISFLVVAFSWSVIGAEGILGYLIPLLIFALPSTLFQLAMKRWKLALPELVAWVAAALPAKLLTYPWF
ncbi:MAG TPA: hypothetical protein VE398_09795 [Acidobacteriota bacterium]|nr:hypothetical protein [Acidobacteriota bacterium]